MHIPAFYSLMNLHFIEIIEINRTVSIETRGIHFWIDSHKSGAIQISFAAFIETHLMKLITKFPLKSRTLLSLPSFPLLPLLPVRLWNFLCGRSTRAAKGAWKLWWFNYRSACFSANGHIVLSYKDLAQFLWHIFCSGFYWTFCAETRKLCHSNWGWLTCIMISPLGCRYIVNRILFVGKWQSGSMQLW